MYAAHCFKATVELRIDSVQAITNTNTIASTVASMMAKSGNVMFSAEMRVKIRGLAKHNLMEWSALVFDSRKAE